MTLMFIIFIFVISLANISNQTSASPVTNKAGRNGFSAVLIHSHSPRSPMYSLNITDADLWASIYYQSNLRLQYFEAVTNPTTLEPALTMRVPLWVVLYQYLMVFSIGTPAVEVHATFDTGSDLLWIQCQPCLECYQQKDPIFDPPKSSSFKFLPCSEPICKKVPLSNCGRGTCGYIISYAGGLDSHGKMAQEEFTFLTTDSNTSTFKISNVNFGCGTYNTGEYSASSQGIVGMSMSPISLLSQMSGWIKGQFSYCLVAVENTRPSSNSQIVFGDRAILIGNSTPLAVPSGKAEWYYLSLLDISVGTDRLSIPPGTFQRDAQGHGGLIMDSGTPLTALKRVGYDILVKKVRKVVDLDVIEIYKNMLCFYGSRLDLDAGKLPPLTFHFQGLDLWLSPYSAYYVVAGRYICMSIVPSDSFSVFGSLMQQNVNIGFDLYKERIFMYATQCAS